MPKQRSGQAGKNAISPEEREKRRQRSLAWHYANRDKAIARAKKWNEEHKEELREKRMEQRRRDPITYVLQRARTRARKCGVPFTLTRDNLPPLPEYCPVFGMKLEFAHGKGGQRDNSPSLDRIIPELGYVPGNVVWVSWRANNLKKDATRDELRLLADFYARIVP